MLNGASARIVCLAECVLRGEKTADIGTDHAYLPIYLIEKGFCDSVIASDVNQGPLNIARKNTAEYSGIDLRLGNGLCPIKNGEVSTVVIAGMGGETIIEILSEDFEKTCSFKRLVLQPRTKEVVLRRWLYENGFKSAEEKLVEEQGRICQVIVAERGSCDYDTEFPELLFNDPLFIRFIDTKIESAGKVLQSLSGSSDRDETDQWELRLCKLKNLKRSLTK